MQGIRRLKESQIHCCYQQLEKPISSKQFKFAESMGQRPYHTSSSMAETYWKWKTDYFPPASNFSLAQHKLDSSFTLLIHANWELNTILCPTPPVHVKINPSTEPPEAAQHLGDETPGRTLGEMKQRGIAITPSPNHSHTLTPFFQFQNTISYLSAKLPNYQLRRLSRGQQRTAFLLKLLPKHTKHAEP